MGGTSQDQNLAHVKDTWQGPLRIPIGYQFGDKVTPSGDTVQGAKELAALKEFHSEATSWRLTPDQQGHVQIFNGEGEVLVTVSNSL